MQLRRKIALLSSALVITAPALTACGFNWATDRENSTVAGANNRTGSVDVLNAVLVSSENGSARLVATFSNNSTDESATVTDVQGATGANDPKVTVTGFKPIDLDAYAMVAPVKDDTAGEILVKGDVERGGYVRLDFTFGDGSTEMVNVPVMAAWEEYDGWGPGGSGIERPKFSGPLSESSTEGSGH